MEQRFGDEARRQLDRLIGGKKIRIAPILKLTDPPTPLDDYRRFLCMAYLTDELPLGETHYFLDGKCQQGTSRRTRLGGMLCFPAATTSIDCCEGIVTHQILFANTDCRK